MTKNKGVFCALGALFFLLFFHTSAKAYFIDVANGARPEGMGEAFVAVADDANAILFNPAGFARLHAMEFTSMYSDLYSNLNVKLYNQQNDHFGYNLLGVGIPIEEINGGLGFGWTQFNTVFYQENTLSLAYGRRIWEPFMLDLGLAVDAGISVKAMEWQVDANEYTSNADYFPFSSRGKYGFTADLGLLVSPWHNFSLGLSMENLVPTDVGLTVTEYVPAIVRAGAAYQFTWKSALINSMLVSLEVSDRDNIYLPKLGVEAWWFDRLVALRAGVNSDQMTTGIGFQYAWDPALLALQLDYSFSYPFQIENTGGSHRLGLTLHWGNVSKRRDEDSEKTIEKISRVNSVLRALKLAREAARTAKEEANEVEAAVSDNHPAAMEIAKKALTKAEEAIQTTVLAIDIIDTAAAEGSDNLKGMATEAHQAADETQKAVQMISGLMEKLMAQLHTVRPVIANKPMLLPDKNPRKIVIGIEQKVITDFGSIREIEPAIQILAEYLKKATKWEVKWQCLTPAELQLAFKQGELDFIVPYEADFSEYRRSNLLEPVATVRTHGTTSQPCVLLVREDAPITTLLDLKGKRLGYSNHRLVIDLNSLFFNNLQGFNSAEYFTSTSKQKNARDSLWALQLDMVDVVVENAYILDVCKEIPEIKIRKIAESKPIPNAMLLMRPSQSKFKREQMQNLLTALVEFDHAPAAEKFYKSFPLKDLKPMKESSSGDRASTFGKQGPRKKTKFQRSEG